MWMTHSTCVQNIAETVYHGAHTSREVIFTSKKWKDIDKVHWCTVLKRAFSLHFSCPLFISLHNFALECISPFSTHSLLCLSFSEARPTYAEMHTHVTLAHRHRPHELVYPFLTPHQVFYPHLRSCLHFCSLRSLRAGARAGADARDDAHAPASINAALTFAFASVLACFRVCSCVFRCLPPDPGLK